jgi:phospholipid/cholesterol/gamma-HCH transport system ATP-binding protein
MIKIINLKKKFDSKWISNGINLTIPKGKMTCIIGRSGEGKSVLLKQIIGLIKPTSGQILINGIDITRLKESEKHSIFKKCGYVFQFAALLDSLTIFENVGLTMLENGTPYNEIERIVKEKLSLVNLGEDILNKYPSELSGGMRKRVGLARTLITDPEIILYDEPTTGLDPITSRLVYELMLQTQKQFNVTSVIISHDIEIFNYVDYIALLHNGVIEYFSEAKDIWKSTNPFVKEFINRL